MTKTCFLCKSSEDDELLYGKFYTKYRISVHYYCLLLSSNLVQNGVNDEVGIFGFLEADIRKENQRTKSCRCYICKGMHANIFCCAKKCLRTFHTVCGIKNRCLAHFTDTFQSWCSAHVPLRADHNPHSAEEPCAICYEEMGLYDRITSIRAPCCKNGWFHQQCVARFAQTAGYFFKCPLCNNIETFTQEVPLRGVYVPERDAAWELEPNAFHEQLVRPSACDAEKCRCKNGRETDNRKWNLLICGSCGATCRHRKCMESTESRTYVCQSCRPITGEVVSRLTVDDHDDESDAEDSEDDQNEASSTISSSSSSVDVEDRAVRKDASHGSEESGCHCSGSDESIVNVRRTKRTRLAIQSESSDSDQSDTSSIVMRRSLMRNTGKRVRRIISEESEATSDKEDSDVATTMLSGEDEINGAPSMSNIEKSAVGQLDENSNTSGTSSLSVGRTHTIRSVRGLARTLLDSSNESDNDDKCKEQSRDRRKKSNPSSLESSTRDEKSLPTMSEDGVKCREQPKRTWSSVDDDCTDSTDDIPLIKRRRVTHLSSSSEENTDPMERLAEKKGLTEILHASPESTKNKLNSSNEENIHPYGDEEIKKHSNHTTPPPPAALVHGFDKSKEKASGKCRGQQSILKFFTNSPRNTPQKLTSSDTDSPMSCSSSFLSGQTADTNKDAASSKQAKVEGSKSLTESEKKSSRRSKEADAVERSNGSRKAFRRNRKQLAVKEQGQANLLHFFNRC